MPSNYPSAIAVIRTGTHLWCSVIMLKIVDFYRVADKSLARPTSRYILFDGENISFDASLYIYIYIFIYI